MSIYSNATEQELINLRTLADQRKNQRDLKIKSRNLKQTHDIKLPESLSPITKKLDEGKESTHKTRDFIRRSQPETPQLSIEKAPTHQRMENIEGVIYDVELENTLKNMRDNTVFFKTHEHPERGWMLNNYPFKLVRGTEVVINDKEYNITPGFQKVFTDTSYNTAKSMNDMEKLVFRDILKKLIIISVYQQKVACQVVIDISKTTSIKT